MQKPNIIIIMADQLRFDLINSTYTPNIQNLINESVSFQQAYCCSPLCVPSRGSFFTSTYPSFNGSIINPWEESDKHHGNVRKEITNLYELFENEWDSWHTGKQHLYTENNIEKRPNNKTKWNKLEGRYGKYCTDHNQELPGGPDYRQYCPEIVNGRFTKVAEYSIPTTGKFDPGLEYFFDGFILKDSLDAIENASPDKPFMLNAMYLAPHPPLQIPEPWFSKFEDVELPETVGKWCEGQSPFHMYQLTGFLGTRYNRDQWAKVWKVYAGLVNLLDHCVGEMVKKLKEKNMYDNSIIVFTSDHGEMLGSHGLWQKMCLYEESARVPLSFKLTNQQLAGTKIKEAVSHIDVLPTLMDLASLEPHKQCQGKSLLPYMQKLKTYNHPVFLQYDGNGGRGIYHRGVIHNNYKLIVDMFHSETYFELYNLADDPLEKNNLAFEKQEEVKSLIEILQEHMKKNNDLNFFHWKDYQTFLKGYPNHPRALKTL